MAEQVKLLKTWSSPYGLRIVWALKLKGVQYDSIDEDLSNKSHLLLHSNPVHKKVPVLLHNGISISESLIILEYIEETWKQNPILPQDSQEKAMARFWAKFGDDKVMPSIWSIFIKGGKEQEEAIAPAAENLKYLEEELRGKKFFSGERVGFVDIALGWIANLISVLEEITEVKLIDEGRFPLLLGWMQEFSNVPFVKESWPSHDKLVTKFRALRDALIK